MVNAQLLPAGQFAFIVQLQPIEASRSQSKGGQGLGNESTPKDAKSLPFVPVFHILALLVVVVTTMPTTRPCDLWR